MEEVAVVVEEGCTTPTTEESRIPSPSECPPAPIKKKPPVRAGKKLNSHSPPKNGYFQSSDLDALFADVARRREAWA